MKKLVLLVSVFATLLFASCSSKPDLNAFVDKLEAACAANDSKAFNQAFIDLQTEASKFKDMPKEERAKLYSDEEWDLFQTRINALIINGQTTCPNCLINAGKLYE